MVHGGGSPTSRLARSARRNPRCEKTMRAERELQLPFPMNRLGLILFTALVGCSSASPETGTQFHEQNGAPSGDPGSGDAPITVTSGGDGEGDAGAPATADADTTTSASACTQGAAECGRPDGSDHDAIYTCMNGAWQKTQACTFGCDMRGAGVACKPNPLTDCCKVVKAGGAQNNNLCDAAPGTAACPMTAARGYCDPNGDKSYTDGD